MNAYNLFGKGEVHRNYPLNRPLIINNKLIKEIIIWAHYEFKHGGYMSDKIILEFIKEELENTNYPPQSEGIREDDGRSWKIYCKQPIYKDWRAYILVWYLEEDCNNLWIVHCYRRKKYDRKKYDR